jgi:hypothetical protein
VEYDLIATHYDRDGDGVFDEARRAKTIYYDRIADLVEDGNPPFRRLEWDEDFDGTPDHAIRYLEADCRLSRTKPSVFKPTFYCAIHSVELSLKGHLLRQGSPPAALTARILLLAGRSPKPGFGGIHGGERGVISITYYRFSKRGIWCRLFSAPAIFCS